MAGDLSDYWKKRDFTRTPEPRGAGTGAGEARLAYVIQKHDATRLHYDLRLEHDGVLKSWAVPKEPLPKRGARHLAVQTEDHPLEYGSFEGEIPESQYGAGTVIVWDRGSWQPLSDAAGGLRDGKLDFELFGERLTGRWTLVRSNSQKGRRRSNSQKGRRRERQSQWLLIKRSDKGSGVATAATAPPPAELAGARRGALPALMSPQLATLVDRVPAGAGWLHEPKLDGYRLLCRIDAGRVTLLTRRGNDWTARFPALAAAAGELGCESALLDGEAVIFDARGLSDFQSLQAAIGQADPAIEFVAFDLLHLDGWDLRRVALVERKRQLAALLAGAPGLISYGEHIEGRGAAFYTEACRIGLEGIVAKRAADGYREKRTRSWLKIKCTRRQEFVIVGFTDPQGSRVGFGALLLATRDSANGPLRYAGKVGTGFDDALLRSLRGRLDALARERTPLPQRPAGLRGAHWVDPELVAEVEFTEWTDEGALRHPTFKGLREDKPAADVVAEHAAAPPSPASPAAPAKAKRVRLTNPGRVLYPEAGITKRQLAEYWERVSPVALEYLRHRPLTLLRCPEGRDAACFYQKHVGAGTPDAIARVHIKKEEDPYAMVDELPALFGLVQIGALELHVWGSRAEHIEQPDIVVFDLDPSEELPWRAVVEAAFDLKERIEALGLAAFARVTGGKGLHVVVPVVPGPKWPSVKRFSRALVNEMVRDDPERYTATVSRSRRVGKIFIDYLRNARGATAIAAYSPRARPGAPVALPVEWHSLDSRAPKPPQYTLADVPALVAERGDPWAGFDAARRPLD